MNEKCEVKFNRFLVSYDVLGLKVSVLTTPGLIAELHDTEPQMLNIFMH